MPWYRTTRIRMPRERPWIIGRVPEIEEICGTGIDRGVVVAIRVGYAAARFLEQLFQIGFATLHLCALRLR